MTNILNKIPVDTYLHSADVIRVVIDPVFFWGSNNVNSDFIEGKLIEVLSRYNARVEIDFDSELEWLNAIVYVYCGQSSSESSYLLNLVTSILDKFDKSDVVIEVTQS